MHVPLVKKQQQNKTFFFSIWKMVENSCQIKAWTSSWSWTFVYTNLPNPTQESAENLLSNLKSCQIEAWTKLLWKKLQEARSVVKANCMKQDFDPNSTPLHKAAICGHPILWNKVPETRWSSKRIVFLSIQTKNLIQVLQKNVELS